MIFERLVRIYDEPKESIHLQLKGLHGVKLYKKSKSKEVEL